MPTHPLWHDEAPIRFVPLTMLRHFVQLHGIEFVAGQAYLEPHPKELMLRNHV